MFLQEKFSSLEDSSDATEKNLSSYRLQRRGETKFFYDFRLYLSVDIKIYTGVVLMLAKTGVFRANRDSNFVRILLHLSKQRFQDIKFFIYSLYTEYIYRRQHDTDYI